MKGHVLFQGDIITKQQKYNNKILENFSIATGPISTKLGTKNPWVKEIQVNSNGGTRPLQRGDNYEIAKILTKFKNSASPEPLC